MAVYAVLLLDLLYPPLKPVLGMETPTIIVRFNEHQVKGLNIRPRQFF